MNLGRGDDDGGGGPSSFGGPSPLPDRLGAGGGGGAPRFADEEEEEVEARRGGGGGGGGALPAFASPPLAAEDAASGVEFIALFCSSRKKSTMNSWLSLMKSSVSPLAVRSWPKCSLHRGSNASSSGNCDGAEPSLEFGEDVGEW